MLSVRGSCWAPRGAVNDQLLRLRGVGTSGSMRTHCSWRAAHPDLALIQARVRLRCRAAKRQLPTANRPLTPKVDRRRRMLELLRETASRRTSGWPPAGDRSSSSGRGISLRSRGKRLARLGAASGQIAGSLAGVRCEVDVHERTGCVAATGSLNVSYSTP